MNAPDTKALSATQQRGIRALNYAAEMRPGIGPLAAREAGELAMQLVDPTDKDVLGDVTEDFDDCFRGNHAQLRQFLADVLERKESARNFVLQRLEQLALKRLEQQRQHEIFVAPPENDHYMGFGRAAV
jgi:hypothetical protein